MTILDCSNLLFNWFSKNDSLFLSKNKNIKDDFKKVVIVTDDEIKDLESLKIALDDYEKSNLIKSSKVENGTYYFLQKPFTAYEQVVTIDANTAENIALIINRFCDENKDKKDYCNPLKITGGDIKNLIYLTLHFASVKKDTED